MSLTRSSVTLPRMNAHRLVVVAAGLAQRAADLILGVSAPADGQDRPNARSNAGRARTAGQPTGRGRQ